uniref:Uncharacterized protein n=1 Tax=Hyaloperonospora arabidopsidis (strain Emoy2) TaxID=559515 RepID=M4BT39_HYAAE
MGCGGQRGCGKENEQRGSEGAELHLIGRGVCSNIAWLAGTRQNQVLILEILSTNGKRGCVVKRIRRSSWVDIEATCGAFGWVLHEKSWGLVDAWRHVRPGRLSM